MMFEMDICFKGKIRIIAGEQEGARFSKTSNARQIQFSLDYEF